jgi:hypothetical protein
MSEDGGKPGRPVGRIEAAKPGCRENGRGGTVPSPLTEEGATRTMKE